MVNLKKNYIWNTSYQILNLIVPLITAPYLSRVLGAEGTGIYSYTYSIISYFILFATLGTSVFGQRSIAYAQSNKEERSRNFFEVLILRSITSIITLILYSIFAFNSGEYKLYYIILSGYIFNVIFDISWFFQGIEKFGEILIRNCVVRVCNIVFIFVFIRSSEDLALYIFSVAAFSILANISMWVILPRYVCFVHGIKPFRNIKDILLLFLPSIATQVYTVLDKSMIGMITASPYQNGCYEQAEKISRMALTVVNSVATVVTPRISNLFKENKRLELEQYIYKSYRFVWMISVPIMFGIIGISEVFVPVFFGDGYEMAKVLMRIFSVLVVAVGLACVTGYSYLISTKQQNIYTIAVTVSAIVNLMVNIILIPQCGAIGAAIASIVAECIGTIIQIAYCCIKKQLKLTLIFNSVWKYAIAGITMLFVLLMLQTVIDITLLGLLVLIAVGGCVYVLTLLILRDGFFVDNVKQAMRQFIK